MFLELLMGKVAKMTRVSVFKKLNHERLYQQSRWDPSVGENEGGLCAVQLASFTEPVVERYHEIGAWISFMQSYLRKAEDVNSMSDNHEEALLILRKVTAMGVACLEQHGCPDRPKDQGQGSPDQGSPDQGSPDRSQGSPNYGCGIPNCPIHKPGGVVDQLKGQSK